MKNENTITTTEMHTIIATIHAKAEAITAEQLARKPEPMPTQGKWTVDTFNYDMATPPRKELVVVGFGKRLAIIDSDHGDGNPYTVPHINAIANARLMAAAPELFESLQELIESIEAHLRSNYEFTADRMSRAKAVIDKATKGTN